MVFVDWTSTVVAVGGVTKSEPVREDDPVFSLAMAGTAMGELQQSSGGCGREERWRHP